MKKYTLEPLIKAVLQNRESRIRKLLKQGASYTKNTRWGASAKDLACYLGRDLDPPPSFLDDKILFHTKEGKSRLIAPSEVPLELQFTYLHHIRFINGDDLETLAEEWYQIATDEQVNLGNAYLSELARQPPVCISIRWLNDVLGYGCFAEKRFKPGELIGEYTGVVKRVSHCDPNNLYHFEYLKSLNGEEWYIDAKSSGNWMRFINHSSKPNVEAVFVVFRGVGHILFVAWNSIEKGEQLFYNYGNLYWESCQKILSDPHGGS